MSQKNWCSEIKDVVAVLFEAERSLPVVGRRVELLAHSEVLRTVLESAIVCPESIDVAVEVLWRAPFVESSVFVPVSTRIYAERLLNVFVTEHTLTSTMNNIKSVHSSGAGGAC